MYGGGGPTSALRPGDIERLQERMDQGKPDVSDDVMMILKDPRVEDFTVRSTGGGGKIISVRYKGTKKFVPWSSPDS